MCAVGEKVKQYLGSYWTPERHNILAYLLKSKHLQLYYVQ